MRWKHKDSRDFTSCFGVEFFVWTRCEKWTLTREDKISHYYNLSLLRVADLWEVRIYYQHDDTSQEGDDTDPHSIVAGTVVFIKHAFCFLRGLLVYVALGCNGCKHHNGKNLQTRHTHGRLNTPECTYQSWSSGNNRLNYSTPFKVYHCLF